MQVGAIEARIWNLRLSLNLTSEDGQIQIQPSQEFNSSYILQGWPTTQLGEEYKPFKSRKDELSVPDGRILWGARVVVLPPGQKSVLEEMHETHLGVSKMKALA